MRNTERGSVTAEFAILIPSIIGLLLFCLQVFGWQLERIQLVNTAGIAARAASHLMTDIEVNALVAKLSPGAVLKLEVDAEVVCARVSQNRFIELSEKLCTRMQGQ
ncbi:MAG: TadE/TadG family type IV pilus assembly protein [Micrococcales bacterium]